MGLFGKKEKKLCPICGKEMGFLSSKVIADGEICEECENRARRVFGMHTFTEYERETELHLMKFRDDMSSATLEDIRAIIALQEKDGEAAKEKLAGLGDFTASFTTDAAFTIDPKPMDVGLKRAKILKGATVVDGVVQSGEFQNGDTVYIVGDGKVEATVLECYKRDASDFQTELSAHMQKKGVKAGEAGWLILDKPAKQGDIIAK